MQKFQIGSAALAMLAALSLGACGEGTHAGISQAEGARSDSGAEITHYICEDGSVVEASYPDTDTARIRYEGQVIEMQNVISGSGARYTGGGWQWWTKGMTEGTLAPLAPGEEIASVDGVLCTAE